MELFPKVLQSCCRSTFCTHRPTSSTARPDGIRRYFETPVRPVHRLSGYHAQIARPHKNVMIPPASETVRSSFRDKLRLIPLAPFPKTRMSPILKFRTRGIFSFIFAPRVLIEYTPGARGMSRVTLGNGDHRRNFASGPETAISRHISVLPDPHLPRQKTRLRRVF